jgi:hypothetical protein
LPRRLAAQHLSFSETIGAVATVKAQEILSLAVRVKRMIRAPPR